MTATDSLLTYVDVAAMLNVSVRQAKRLKARNLLKPISFGARTIRFRRADVVRLISTRAGDRPSDL